MITYKLIKRLVDRLIYEYYVDGDESAPGLVALYDDGTGQILEPSKNDIKNIFAGKALCRINTKYESGTIAMW